MDNNLTDYPSKYETEVVLHDGSRILLRPIRKDDTELWLAFLSRLSTHTKYLRFNHVPKQMEMEDTIRFCTVDYTNTFAIVAETIKEQRKDIVAIGRYYRLPNKRSAEVALVIEDAYQGKGIGTKLIECLVNIARDNGITTFEADVLASNQDMMKVFAVFDTPAEGYQIREALSEMKSIKGVNSIDLLERVAGEVPNYCVTCDLDDDGAEETGAALLKAINQYSQQISNLAWGAYKNIG